MKFLDQITQHTINEEINRICNTTDEVYALRDKLANLNHALDEYWFLAAESAPQFTFDDTSNTSGPVETANLVAGTNNYKLGDLTNTVLQILRVSILDDNAEEYDLIYQDFDDVNDFLESYSTDSDDRDQPQYYTVLGDYVYIAPTPDYSETNGFRIYMNRELSKYEYQTYTATNADNTLTDTAHGLVDGDTVILSTAGVMPNGWTADTQVYYVRDKTADTFKIATTEGGTAVTIADDGTGTQKYVKLSRTPGIPVIHHDFLGRYAAYQFLDAQHPKFAKLREQLAMDKRDIQDYWQSRIRQGKTIIETKKRAYK